jgi:hypothetical protein
LRHGSVASAARLLLPAVLWVNRQQRAVIDYLLEENRVLRGWGYTRIRGGLKRVGHDVARNSIKEVSAHHGVHQVDHSRGRLDRECDDFLASDLGLNDAL